MSECLDDRCLIEAIRAGKKDAFGTLVHRYEDRLYATLLRLTGRAEDARDLFQEAITRAWIKLDRFHGESSFYTWIYRIAVNLALSDRRRKRLAGHVTASLSVEGPQPAEDTEFSDPTLPIERAEQERLIQQALNELQPDHRAVVVMSHFDDLRYEEIAKILRIPVGTVRSRLHRAREVLRDRLSEILDMEPARTAAPERA